MKNFNKNDYVIISKPDYIVLECPYCRDEIQVDFEDVGFITDYWDDGGWCDCPNCGKEIELGDYDYD